MIIVLIRIFDANTTKRIIFSVRKTISSALISNYGMLNWEGKKSLADG